MTTKSQPAPVCAPLDAASNLAFYLLEKTGSIFGRHGARMLADEQRALFGRFIGKGRIIIDGSTETVRNRVTVAFGQHSEDRSDLTWRDLTFPA